ncbi:hypothetical protein AB40_1743 [Escherichia coli 1-182-04_S1_C2]|nr:hypothetical protein AB40_1743 [Escherichia coli 1-182-04_S1_C2]
MALSRMSLMRLLVNDFVLNDNAVVNVLPTLLKILTLRLQR